MSPKEDAADIVRATSDDVNRQPSAAGGEDMEKIDAINNEMATEATLAEHNLTTWQAIVKYRKAAAWSIFVSLCIIMRAYDIDITGGFYAMPAFQRSFGEPSSAGGYQVPVQWQVAMSLGATVGQICGSWIVGFPMERIGRKKTLAIYLVLSTGIIFMQFFAPNRRVLVAAYYLAGIIWGGYQVLAPTYASEVLPMRLRGIFTTYVALCYNIGSLLQTGISRGLLNWTAGGAWQWRVAYAIQWLWPLVILSFLYWTPESPWWLIRQHRLEDAKKSLDRLSDRSEHAVTNHNVLAMMVKTDTYEQDSQLGATFADCFRSSNRRRLEICAAVFIVQDFSGNPSSFAVYLFEQIGLTSKQAFDMGVGLSAMGFVGVLLAAPLIAYIGRRRIWLAGLWYNLACMWVVGFLTLAHNYKTNHAYPWVQATLLITMQLTSHLSISPLSYVISSEVPSTKLRAKTLGITASINGVCALVITVAGPYLLNPGAAGAGAKIQFLWGGLTIFCLLWSYFRLPETSNRTYEELDIMFKRGVPTKQFKTYDTSVQGQEDVTYTPN